MQYQYTMESKLDDEIMLGTRCIMGYPYLGKDIIMITIYNMEYHYNMNNRNNIQMLTEYHQ